MLRAAAAAGDGGSPDPAPGDPRHRPGPHPFVAAVDLPPPGRPPGRPDGARVSRHARRPAPLGRRSPPAPPPPQRPRLRGPAEPCAGYPSASC
jgi:hypothetical protein